MRDFETDGRMQVTAAISLLEFSGLIRWDRENSKFVATSPENFGAYWRNSVDQVFGRLICWISFSAGSEFLVKGVCLLQKIEIRKKQEVPNYPSPYMDLKDWTSRFCENSNFAGIIDSTNYGTLGDLLYKKPKSKSEAALKLLCYKMEPTQSEERIVMAAYRLLARTIRNRDAHAYVPNVRDEHFWLVPKLFEDCFNLLVSWLPGGRQVLNCWLEDPASFIAEL